MFSYLSTGSGLMGIEFVSRQMEHPFGNDESDIPLRHWAEVRHYYSRDWVSFNGPCRNVLLSPCANNIHCSSMFILSHHSNWLLLAFDFTWVQPFDGSNLCTHNKWTYRFNMTEYNRYIEHIDTCSWILFEHWHAHKMSVQWRPT